MKTLLFFTSLVILLFACNKDDNGPSSQNTNTPSSYQDHIWVFDSSFTVTPNYSTSSYATSEEQTLVFSSDTLVKKTGSYAITYNTAYQSPNIIYFWVPGSILDASMYFITSTLTDAKLVTSQLIQADQQVTTYYHSK